MICSPGLTLTAMLMLVAPAAASPPAADPPPIGGTISIEVHGAPDEGDAAPGLFLEAASRTLAQKGFTILQDPGHAAYVAEVTLGQGDVGTSVAKIPPQRSAVQPGALAGAGGGVVIPFSTGQSKLVPLVRTRLDVRIHKRGAQTIVWRGAALTVRPAGTRAGSDAAVASALTDAVLRDYPQEPGDVVGVP